MSSGKSTNQSSPQFQQGKADAKNNNFQPPSGPSMIDCALNPKGADQQTQKGTDYRAGYKAGNGK